MTPAMTITRTRLERLLAERAATQKMQEDVLKRAEDNDGRDLSPTENEEITRYRTRIPELDTEIESLTGDLERAEKSVTASTIIRVREPQPATPAQHNSGGDYASYAQYARDLLIVRHDNLAREAAGLTGNADVIRQQAQERLERVEHTLTADVPGLLAPPHITEIMDIVNGSRPVVASAKSVNLNRGRLTYPKIAQRPEVLLQASEKTEGGTKDMEVSLEEIQAKTYIGGGNLSWQTITWSDPDALSLWFELAAEAYARKTEAAACTELVGSATSGTAGTVSPALGTTGTEDFGDWRAAAIQGAGAIYTTTAGRARTDTLYLSADMFFNLAGVGSSDVVQMSAVGSIDIGSMTGTFSGFRVVGSYAFPPGTAILGDRNAFLSGENAGAPIQLRAVEPAIAGMEVGVVGFYAAKVFDTDRFLHLT